ncbi:hypothetical protein C8Q76DRAFT_632066 [Earliella scabrosa]|nr:hypothetical protein C8Q76DRAFT_632066 [Earliella scabrosa]
MSSNIVLPDLPTWVQQHIQDVYSAKSDKDFNQAFDLFVAPDATIRLNGRQMQRDEYKKVLRGQTTGDARADIEFRDVVAAPAQVSTGPTVPVGAVGASFRATLYNKFLVFGQRESNTVHSSLNVQCVRLLLLCTGCLERR